METPWRHLIVSVAIVVACGGGRPASAMKAWQNVVMSYLVLARKWRPKRFAELVGQEHVVRALSNALDTGRVHHAFLFTGTRGVGKTTIARIFAKSLNCERGTSAEPCGECNSCRDIDAGRFIDLLEIDAASNTGVDDVREVIDNAQYMPSRGRVKVYLIDEVHMLSKSAFNALLKTLEEPPGHVKFLLATTDPQKLPVTVLSRCLQFNLKRLDEAQIQGQITKILAAEGIPAEPGAIRQLSKAADGSLRDGLSLLDQAIAYTGASSGAGSDDAPGAPLTDAGVATMLGTVDRMRVGALLQSLTVGDGAALIADVAALAEFSPEWSSVLDAVAEALHRIQVRQLVPAAEIDADGVDVDAMAGQLRPEVVQLWYQMALQGRRDLAFAPSPRAGFEMAVLRMLAFRPADDGATSLDKPVTTQTARGPAAARAALDAGAAPTTPPLRPLPAAAFENHAVERPVAPERPASPASATAPPAFDRPSERPAERPVSPQIEVAVPAESRSSPDSRSEPSNTAMSPPAVDIDNDRWLDLVARSGLRGPARELAAHAAFVGYTEGTMRLSLSPDDDHLRAPALVKSLSDVLSTQLGGPVQIKFEAGKQMDVETLHQRNARQRDAKQAAAEEAFLGNPDVQRLMNQQGAKLVPDSIRPFEE
jgi:DNA polymerase III subunit gamma/tau